MYQPHNTLKRFIDTLSPEQIDNVLMAQDWARISTTGAGTGGGRCLLGQALNLRRVGVTVTSEGVEIDVFKPVLGGQQLVDLGATVGAWFDLDTMEHGLDVVVAAIKAYAAKRNNAAVAYYLSDGDTPIEAKPQPKPAVAPSATTFAEAIMAAAKRHAEQAQQLSDVAKRWSVDG